MGLGPNGDRLRPPIHRNLGAPEITVEPKWQLVQSSRDRETRRLPVPGGWLYLVHELAEMGSIMGQLMTFVPKPAKVDVFKAIRQGVHDAVFQVATTGPRCPRSRMGCGTPGPRPPHDQPCLLIVFDFSRRTHGGVFYS